MFLRNGLTALEEGNYLLNIFVFKLVKIVFVETGGFEKGFYWDILFEDYVVDTFEETIHFLFLLFKMKRKFCIVYIFFFNVDNSIYLI